MIPSNKNINWEDHLDFRKRNREKGLKRKRDMCCNWSRKG